MSDSKKVVGGWDPKNPLRLRRCDNCGTEGMDVDDALNLWVETRIQFVCRNCGEVVRVNRNLETGEERLVYLLRKGSVQKC